MADRNPDRARAARRRPRRPGAQWPDRRATRAGHDRPPAAGPRLAVPAEGDTELALSEVEEVGRRATRARYLNPAAMAWRSRSAGLLAGDGDGDRERARRGRSRPGPRLRPRRAIGVALRRRGAIAGGEEGLADLREAIDLLDGAARVEHARAVVELAGRCTPPGEEDARETLYRGMDLAHRSGAHALVEEAMDGLRATGARPRRPRVTGIDALTPQERRIAQMARGRATARSPRRSSSPAARSRCTSPTPTASSRSIRGRSSRTRSAPGSPEDPAQTSSEAHSFAALALVTSPVSSIRSKLAIP